MQTHASEAADHEDNLPARFEQKSRVQKMLYKVGSTFDDGERGPVSGQIFRGILQVVRHAKETNLEYLFDWR
jgi:hypothetical protein